MHIVVCKGRRTNKWWNWSVKLQSHRRNDEKEKEKNILRCKNKKYKEHQKRLEIQDKRRRRRKTSNKINEEQIDEKKNYR